MSLTSDDLADIKQLVQSVVSTALVENNKMILKDLNQRFTEQDEKLDEILDAVGTDLAKHTASIDDHETRIVRLEKHPV